MIHYSQPYGPQACVSRPGKPLMAGLSALQDPSKSLTELEQSLKDVAKQAAVSTLWISSIWSISLRNISFILLSTDPKVLTHKV